MKKITSIGEGGKTREGRPLSIWEGGGTIEKGRLRVEAFRGVATSRVN